MFVSRRHSWLINMVGTIPTQVRVGPFFLKFWTLHALGIFSMAGVEEILKNIRSVRTAPPCILAIANVRFLGRTYLLFGFD